MNYLVTGGAGFIGSNFLHYMVNKYPNSIILCIDALTYAGNYNNIKVIKKKIIHYISPFISLINTALSFSVAFMQFTLSNF